MKACAYIPKILKNKYELTFAQSVHSYLVDFPFSDIHNKWLSISNIFFTAAHRRPSIVRIWWCELSYPQTPNAQQQLEKITDKNRYNFGQLISTVVAGKHFLCISAENFHYFISKNYRPLFFFKLIDAFESDIMKQWSIRIQFIYRLGSEAFTKRKLKVFDVKHVSHISNEIPRKVLVTLETNPFQSICSIFPEKCSYSSYHEFCVFTIVASN